MLLLPKFPLTQVMFPLAAISSGFSLLNLVFHCELCAFCSLLMILMSVALH